MESIIFDRCFGWLHDAPGDRGVVLCNPFGYEALCTHRGWRKLATRLADAGMPTLRFDYPGTGDSAGDENDPQLFDAWVDSINSAVELLRQRTGVRQVSLVGLRLGGALAALAAERIGGVENLVMLAPVITGSAYLRELRALRRQWIAGTFGLGPDAGAEDDGSLEVHGFKLSSGVIARLGQIDLCVDTHAPARRVVLLDSIQPALTAALEAYYAAKGVSVTRDSFDEGGRFLAEPVESVTPTETIVRITDLLAGGAETTVAQSTSAPEPDHVDEISLEELQASEQPVVFGRHFGIYCKPVARADGPAILIVNSGPAHHVGDARMSVTFARRLAARGIPSLRMDIGGLGDASPAVETVNQEMLFSENACADAYAGVDWLVRQGNAGVVLFGLCSGAYVALHVSARHPSAVGGYAINLPTFMFRKKASAAGTAEFSSTREYRRALRDRRRWLKVLRGQSHPFLIARELARRVARDLYFAAGRFRLRTRDAAIPDREVRRLVRTLEAKDARVRLIYGEFDVGVDEAKANFGADFSSLRAFQSVSVAVLPGIDHALFSARARSTVIADVERWLQTAVMNRELRNPAATGRDPARTLQF
jgi:pimeloyl-ACP methyl ester carboxylesterase